jgi:hypothetical protein
MAQSKAQLDNLKKGKPFTSETAREMGKKNGALGPKARKRRREIAQELNKILLGIYEVKGEGGEKITMTNKEAVSRIMMGNNDMAKIKLYELVWKMQNREAAKERYADESGGAIGEVDIQESSRAAAQQLAGRYNEAGKILFDLLHCDDAKAQLGAARSIFDTGAKLTEEHELEARIAALEAAAQGGKGNG